MISGPQIPSDDAGSALAETVAALFPPRACTCTEPAAERTGSRRLRLWEIDPSHHCVVIGTCVSMPALRRLARQGGIAQWDSASDYGLHHAAVSHARERCTFSSLIHKHLERDFAPALHRFSRAKSDADLRTLWNQALQRGEVAGPLWAVMTSPHASETTLCVIGEELHMLSHQAGAASRADLKRLAELERECACLAERLQRVTTRSARELAQKDELITALEARAAGAADAERARRDAEARLHALENEGELVLTRQRLAEASRQAQEAEARARLLAGADVRCARLEQRLERMRRRCEAAERAGLAGETATPDEAQAESASEGLRGRCVLYVGGRCNLVEHYRTLVERCCGTFVHHDGGVEHNAHRLQALLASADAVVCAAGNVNHGAYYTVKRYCKQDGKPCLLLRNASVSAFARGIRALGGQAFAADARDTLLAKHVTND